MKLTDKELLKLKTKLMLDGYGSKMRLSLELKCEESQISRTLREGTYPKRCATKLKKYLNS